jgi:acetylornithine deacetylase
MQTGIEGSARKKVDDRLDASLEILKSRLIATVADLVRIPSENTPPHGSEAPCQQYVCQRLRDLGLEAELYEPALVPGLLTHPAFHPGRDYNGRPNMSAVWRGTGGGRSLLLSGHIDTVPRGSEPWSRDPFGAEIEGNRMYGLGSNDMKGGVGAMVGAVEALLQAGIRLRGDVRIETIVDEEFGGVTGTLAGRVRGPAPDAAIICEPSQTVICPAHVGGRTAHITLRAGGTGILYEGAPPARAIDQLQYLLANLNRFAEKRKKTAPPHPLYEASQDPVPVWVTKVYAGGWGTREPITIPNSCRIELYWQTMPGEEQEAVEKEFFEWLDSVVNASPHLFPIRPEVQFPIQWLPGSAIDAGHELVSGLSETFHAATGTPAQVQGIGGPCDMFVFHQHFGVPAVLFGPKGGNTHAPDEWVDLDSVFLTTQVLARFICDWCGIEAD